MKFVFLFALLFAFCVHAQDEYVEEPEFAEQAEQQIEEEPLEQKIVRPRRPQPLKEIQKAESKDYTLEKIVGGCLVVYLIYFFVGKTLNSNTVTK